MNNKDTLFETDDFKLIVTYNSNGLACDYSVQSLNDYLVGIKIDSGCIGNDKYTTLVYKITIKNGLQQSSMSDEFVIGFIKTLQSALEFKQMCIKYFKDNDLYFKW